MPPQTTDQDFGLAKEGLERTEQTTLLDCQTPSTPYWERKMGEVSTGFTAEPLTHVTNKTQEEATKQQPRRREQDNDLRREELGLLPSFELVSYP